MVTVETKPYRGHWIARLSGEDPKYGLRREFETGYYVKSRRVREYHLRPGWYEIAEGYGQPRRYVAAGEINTEPVPELMVGMMDKISAGPNPGQPGAWMGPQCQCGAEVTAYDEDGWPRCDQHEETTA